MNADKEYSIPIICNDHLENCQIVVNFLSDNVTIFHDQKSLTFSRQELQEVKKILDKELN